MINPTQLEAALTNLATNARDAMPNGGTLVIATGNGHLDAEYAASHPEVAAGDYALIEITDSGTGIPPSVISRIFESFFTTKRSGKGGGLGLNMIYGFMKQSKGHASVYREVGFGTTFRLYVPLADADSSAPQETASRHEPRGNGETVLAIEDVALLCKVAVRQLIELGYRVIEADGATAALSMPRGPKPSTTRAARPQPLGVYAHSRRFAACAGHPRAVVLEDHRRKPPDTSG